VKVHDQPAPGQAKKRVDAASAARAARQTRLQGPRRNRAARFEGGQTPLHARQKAKGFKNPFRMSTTS
jgi:hypothetical protein